MNDLLAKAQKMQADMEKAQAETAQIIAEGSAGGGAVVAKVNGKYELLSIKIDPAAFDPEDITMLEDMVMGALNTALSDVKARVDERMGQVTGGMQGLGIPGLGF